jgi:hypothetical protein
VTGNQPNRRVLLVVVGIAFVLLAIAQYFGWVAGPPPLFAPASVRPRVLAADDRPLVDSLMNEPDEHLMIKRAEAAGLKVEKIVTAGPGAVYKIIDPETNVIVLTRSIMP